MRTLSLETSTIVGQIALADGETVIAERVLNTAGRRHAQMLLAEIAGLTQEAGWKPADLQLIAVSHGPGSFTGLRVGITAAKTIAYSLRIPMVLVPSLPAVACAHGDGADHVAAIEDAQRGDLFVAMLSRDSAGEWPLETPVQLVSAKSWFAQLPPDIRIAGPGAIKLKSLVPDPPMTDPSWTQPASASLIGRLGQRLYRQTGGHDLATAEPLYVRPSAAEEKRAAQQ